MGDNVANKNWKAGSKASNAAGNRVKGVARATDRLTKEDTEKYGEYSSYIVKAKKTLDYLKEHNQEHLEDFLFNYLEELGGENI